VKPSSNSIWIGTTALTLIAMGVLNMHSYQKGATPTAVLKAKPLLLEKNEGELRTRRIREVPVPSAQFLLKVSPKNNGSQHLVLATEDIPAGAAIPTHKHFEMDEILFLQSGSAHARVGGDERDLHAGGLLFIPAESWVDLKNIGSDPVSVVFLFSSPGFDDYLRCTSVAANEKVTSMTNEEWKQCQQRDTSFSRCRKKSPRISFQETIATYSHPLYVPAFCLRALPSLRIAFRALSRTSGGISFIL
jgi:quercetin dioxygenase-like cupin family protein